MWSMGSLWAGGRVGVGRDSWATVAMVEAGIGIGIEREIGEDWDKLAIQATHAQLPPQTSPTQAPTQNQPQLKSKCS